MRTQASNRLVRTSNFCRSHVIDEFVQMVKENTDAHRPSPQVTTDLLSDIKTVNKKTPLGRYFQAPLPNHGKLQEALHPLFRLPGMQYR